MAKRLWLMEARLAKGLSRSDIATAVGIHETYIEKIENGTRTPRIPTAVRIGRVLGIPDIEIVGRFVKDQISKVQ